MASLWARRSSNIASTSVENLRSSLSKQEDSFSSLFSIVLSDLQQFWHIGRSQCCVSTSEGLPCKPASSLATVCPLFEVLTSLPTLECLSCSTTQGIKKDSKEEFPDFDGEVSSFRWTWFDGRSKLVGLGRIPLVPDSIGPFKEFLRFDSACCLYIVLEFTADWSFCESTVTT